MDEFVVDGTGQVTIKLVVLVYGAGVEVGVEVGAEVAPCVYVQVMQEQAELTA